MASHRYGLILAGGRGTRFWPRSRTRTPKQLLPFLGEQSLLQETVERLRPVIPPERIWILTNEQLRSRIRKQLPEVPPEQVLAEPAQRNTAPCLGLAAQILCQMDRDAVLGVFPADHHITYPARFRKLLKPAFAAAEEGKLATIGIQPRWPETGYGYLEFADRGALDAPAASPVARFREKPDHETAVQYLTEGRYCWNAGMFFWRADAFLDAMRKYLPKTASLLASLPAFGERSFAAKLKMAYPRVENISVDYGIMEKSSLNGAVMGVPAGDIGWTDLGSWNAVYELLPHDKSGNVARGSALLHESTGCFVQGGRKLIALAGVKNLVVVDTPDAILVVDREQAQKVSGLVKLLEQQKLQDLL